MLLAVLGFSFTAYADVTKSCKVSGGQDGATVVASVIEVGDGYVLVELNNDGTFAVNVKVSVSGPGSGNMNNRGCLVPQQSSKTIKIIMPKAKASDNITSYHVTSISGARCN